MDEEKIYELEALATISYVARNVAGHALAWNFMRAHWDDIKDGQVVIYNLLCSGGDDLMFNVKARTLLGNGCWDFKAHEPSMPVAAF